MKYQSIYTKSNDNLYCISVNRDLLLPCFSLRRYRKVKNESVGCTDTRLLYSRTPRW